MPLPLSSLPTQSATQFRQKDETNLETSQVNAKIPFMKIIPHPLQLRHLLQVSLGGCHFVLGHGTPQSPGHGERGLRHRHRLAGRRHEPFRGWRFGDGRRRRILGALDGGEKVGVVIVHVVVR